MRPARGFHGIRQLDKAPDIKIDQSVLDRLNADPAKHKNLEKECRPENLLAYLAANPEYDTELSQDLLATITEMRKKG